MRIGLATILLLIVHLGHTQAKKDTFHIPGKEATQQVIHSIDTVNQGIHSNVDNNKILGDSTTRKALLKADAFRSEFLSRADSLQSYYRRPINQMDSVKGSLQHRIDSLHALKLPTAMLTTKLDSVNKARAEKVWELNQKVDKLKANATKGLSEITLPPEMSGPVKNLEQSIQGFKVTTADGRIPDLNTNQIILALQIPGYGLPGNLNAPGIGNGNVPGVKGVPGINNVPVAGELNNLSRPVTDLSKVTGQVSEYGKEAKSISQGKMDEAKNLNKVVEDEALKNQGMGELKGKTGELDKYKQRLGDRPDSAALDMLKSQAMPAALNHFAGQEKALLGTMSQMTKLKSRYNQVKSTADLPKKLPNPLHDTPFIERLIPGVTFQLYSKGHFMMDITPSALYRITPRFSAGAGWVERISFDGRKQSTDHVFGPRAILQFNWSRGFSLRFQPELLNAFVPPQLIPGPAPESGRREWVWSAIVGIKKDFKVYKKIKGNTEVLYNLYNPENKSPYPDRLLVRFGFEFPVKKRQK